MMQHPTITYIATLTDWYIVKNIFDCFFLRPSLFVHFYYCARHKEEEEKFEKKGLEAIYSV